jgi:hypothetical protein
MKSIVILLLLFCNQVLHSQYTKQKYGQIGPDEIRMETYLQDTTAKAVVLFDTGDSKFVETNKGFIIRHTRHKRIKIFDQEASDLGNIIIPYYVEGNKREKVTDIKATTYNFIDGIMLESSITKSDVFEETKPHNWRVKKFAFPNVTAGSILEYSYVYDTPFLVNLPDWYFQSSIPTLVSQYEVSLTPVYEYVSLLLGDSSFDYTNSVLSNQLRRSANGFEYKDMIHTYVKEHIPAFKDEGYVYSANDNIIQLDFQLSTIHFPQGGSKEFLSTWPKLTEALFKNDHFGKFIKNAKKIASRLLKNELNLTSDPVEKSQMIINYVKSNFGYNGRKTKYANQSAKDFYANKSGNSAELNLFLLALLLEAGIPSKPIILSTREHGKIPNDYPFDHFTNYVIVGVDLDKPFLTDATARQLTYKRLPIYCINDSGLILNGEDKTQWVVLENKIPSIDQSIIDIEVKPDELSCDFTVKLNSTEYEAFKQRLTFKDNTKTILDHFEKIYDEVDEVITLNYETIEKPYSITLKGRTAIEQLGNKYLLNPLLFLPISYNEMTANKRTHPVEFEYLINKLFKSSVNIPTGYAFKGSAPDPISVDNDLVTITLSYTLNSEKELIVLGNYMFKQNTYSVKDYTKIKSYIDLIVKEFNKAVIIEKS